MSEPNVLAANDAFVEVARSSPWAFESCRMLDPLAHAADDGIRTIAHEIATPAIGSDPNQRYN